MLYNLSILCILLLIHCFYKLEVYVIASLTFGRTKFVASHQISDINFVIVFITSPLTMNIMLPQTLYFEN